MRVLHIYKDYPPVKGGIEKHVHLLAERQAETGLEVTVLVTSTTRTTQVEEWNGVRVIRAGRWATCASAPLSLDLFRFALLERPDVTHLHFPYPLGEVAHLALGRSRATVVTYHSDIIRQRRLGTLYRPVLQQLLRRADRVLASSPQYVRTSPHLRRFPGKCTVVPLGIDPAPFARPDLHRTACLRSSYGSPLLLFVGKLRYYKGLEYLFLAMERLAAHLVVVGEGPMDEVWRAEAARSPARERIHFAGEVADAVLPDYYAAADLFVLPSSHRSEAFGLVQLEAMAAGLPVISTEVGTGTSFVNADGETGLVVPPRDPDALVEAAAALLADPMRRAHMGRSGRRRVWDCFQVAPMVERTIQVYREVLRMG